MHYELALSFAVILSCAKPASSTTTAADAAPSPAESAVALAEASAPKKLAALSEPPNDDFRLKSIPDSITKVGAVLVNRSGQPFVEIVGVDVPQHVRVEEGFVVRTYFKVLGTTPENLEIGLHVDGMKARFNGDHAPMGGHDPTSQWKTGEILVDAVAARVVHPGSYKVYVALEMPSTAISLKVTSGAKANDEGFVLVASIEAQ